MDTRQFSLTRPPFAATPQPSCCFPHEKWQHTLDELVVRLRAGQGTCVLTGQAGLGKTLALKVVAHELHREFCILSLPAPGVLDTLGLQQCLLAELEVGRIEGGPTELRLALVHELRGLIRNGRPGVILLDEAQTVAAPLLEELRTLAIQDEGGEPLARILVAGQPAFEETLAGPGFEAFNQQVACHKVLEPLGLTESVEYILHRVAWAGGDPESLFCIEALDAVVRAAGGNPRLINRACDLALLLAAAREQPAVDAESMQLALDDLQKLALPWQPTARDSRAADDSQFAATNPAAWPGIALDADVTGWEEPDQSQADAAANWSSAQGVGLDDSRGQQPSEGVDDNSADHAGSRPGDGLRDESRADREGDDFAEPTWPTGVASLGDEGRHAEGLFGPRAKSSNPPASNPPPSEPPADRRRASASSVGAEPSALSPELPTRGTSPAWQPVVPVEKPIQPGQDPFEGFEPVLETVGDSDPSGEYRWLLPGASGGAPISAGDRSSRRVTGTDELAGGRTAGPSPSAAQSAPPKFETHVEPPVGVARLPLGTESHRFGGQVSVSPGHRASADAPPLARREYGLRGSPRSGPSDGSEEEEFDVVEPDSPAEGRGDTEPGDHADLVEPSTHSVPGSAPTEVASTGPDRTRPDRTHSDPRRPGTTIRSDLQHPIPPAAPHSSTEHTAAEAVPAGGTTPTPILGRLFSRLRSRMNTPAR